jgi:hypothetical protein
MAYSTNKTMDTNNLLEIQKYLQEKGIYAEIDEYENELVVSIEWGDWKHEHGYCDYLMTLIGYTSTGQMVTEEDGSDCYSAEHYYTKIV